MNDSVSSSGDHDKPREADHLEPAASNPPAEWWLDRALAEQLYSLVERHDLSNVTLDGAIASLLRRHGHAVYAELIFLLTRLRLEPAEALRLWPGVLERQAELSTRTGAGADIRVALLSYFLDVDRQFVRPKVVEMRWVERTAASALLDDVTGLPNQRYFRAQFHREIQRSLRENTPLSLIVLDADDFKRVNDLLGHEIGTATLEGLAKVLRANARDADLVVRYGGDEFVVLLPATPKGDAARVAEELRKAVQAYQIQPGDGSSPLSLTVSVGVATCPADARDESPLFVAADQALYDAKRAGKNRVCLFAESTRSFHRRRAVWPAQIAPAGAPAIAVQTLEVGEGGFSFRSEHVLAVGTLVDAALTTPDGSTLRMAGRVVWSRVESPNLQETAVRFVEPSNDRERLALWVCSA